MVIKRTNKSSLFKQQRHIAYIENHFHSCISNSNSNNNSKCSSSGSNSNMSLYILSHLIVNIGNK